MFTYITDFFAALWMVSCMMAPWLLFGFFAAGVLSVFFSPGYIYKHMGKPGFKSIFKAALFGVPLPICSCGVVPITVSLKKQGAGRGAAGSFLISTPQTGLDSFFATYAMLGWVLAIFRPIVAFITGIVGGLLMENFGAPKNEKETETSDDNSEEDQPRVRGWKTIPAVLHYGFIKLLGNISSALLVGLVLAALITLFVPADFGAKYLKSDWLAMPAMLLFGIPLYVCSTASIPIAASLIVKGISPGAALVFLITGPATNIATITIMSKVLGKKAVVIYVVTVAIAAVIAGYIFNMLNVNLPIMDIMRSGGKMEISLLQQVSCIILFALLAFTILQRLAKRFGIGTKNLPSDLEIEVQGMTCEHCADSISRALKHVDGILKLDIDISSGIIKINAETPHIIYPLIEKVISDAGFSCSLKENKAEKSCCTSCCSDE
jgi:uncharacterized protein